jgi:hypothetical protein
MKKMIGVCVCASLFYGCASIPPIPYTESAYQEKLTEWVGKDPNALILSWGPPNSTFEMPNGNKMYTWLSEKKDIAVYSSGNSYQYINRSYGPISNLLSETHMDTASILDEKRYWCQTSFVSDKNVIVGWVVKGNTCIALDLKNSTDAQKKLQFFGSLKAGNKVELILKEAPSDRVVYQFHAVSNYPPGSIRVSTPTSSTWSESIRDIPFPEIVSYKNAER